MDISKMVKEAEEMKKRLLQTQTELANTEIRGEAANGLVVIILNGQGELKDIKIKKEAVDPNNTDALEDLIVSAFRAAFTKADAISKEMLGKLSEGLPGIE